MPQYASLGHLRSSTREGYTVNTYPFFHGKQVVSLDVLFARSRFARTESRFARSMKSSRLSLFLLDIRIKRNKPSSRFFLIDLMMSLTQINRQKSCVNILHSKKDAHKHKYKCGLSVRAKRLLVLAKRLRANRTSGETTVIPFTWSRICVGFKLCSLQDLRPAVSQRLF